MSWLISTRCDTGALFAGLVIGQAEITISPTARSVLFLLFPRISGPLWGTPGDRASGSTGLSNSMSPGSISRLLESTEIAFRVKFESNPPDVGQLYWRGPVFGSFNGRTWSPLTQRLVEPGPPVIEGDRSSIVEYTVTMEPHQRDWLFALEMPASPVRRPSCELIPFRVGEKVGHADRSAYRSRSRWTPKPNVCVCARA